MSYATNIEHDGGCPDCDAYERKIDRMNAKESELREEIDNLKEAMKTNSETMRIWRGHAMEEILQYREALTEAKEVLQWHLDNSAPCHAIYHSDFFNLTANAITQAKSVLSKFQPKKDENNI